MRLSFSIALFSVLVLAACGGSGSTTTPTATYSVSLGVISSSGAAPSPEPAVVLYDGQFLDPSHVTVLLGAVIVPAAPSATITWTSSSAAIIAQHTQPDTIGTIPTAPPDSTYATLGSAYGVSTLQAQVGAPVNQSASISVYHFPSLSFGCRFRYTPAFSFDPGSTASGSSSDFYDTMGIDQLGPLDPCLGTPLATAAGTPEVWHVPYGGTFVANATLASFAAIAASS